MKKLNNKGFTLVEIVIVIVIIAILAAMLVPSLTQWIDKSKKKTFISACGTVRTAVAAELSNEYATDSSIDTIGEITSWATISQDVGKSVSNTEVPTGGYQVTGTTSDNMTVSDGKWTSTFNGTAWSEATTVTPVS